MRRISSNSNRNFNFSFPEFLYRIRGRTSNRNRDVEKGISSNSAASSSAANSNKHNESETASPKCSTSINNNNNNNNNKASTSTTLNECNLCYLTKEPDSFYTLEHSCKHRACKSCFVEYLSIEILESRTEISCPSCPEKLNPIDIQNLLKSRPNVIAKYEEFMVRRVLVQTEPDSRFCPAPDCTFVVIATGCASCPLIQCQKPNCGVQFCYHCKDFWHENQTCDAARRGRQSGTSRRGSSEDSQHRSDQTIKPCPRCNVLIVKMDDGSCNHMVCAVCGSEFCWLCMKEITDLHYLSPSGCTFWGTKPWSKKKKLLWQLGTLIGAPVGIALVAGIAVPAMIIGIPVWIGRKVFSRYKKAGKKKRFCLVFLSSLVSILVSPILAALAVAIGIPVLLFYIYGVVPISLCRQSCAQNSKFEFDDEEITVRNNHEDAISKNLSIGEVSLSVGSHFRVGGNASLSTFQPTSSIRESTTALNGSINREAFDGHKLEVQADVSLSETASCQSTRALAGSLLNYKSSYAGEGENNSERDVNIGADKSSLGSGRSFKSSERSFRDDSEPSKKIAQRIPKLSNCQNTRTGSEDHSMENNKIMEDEQELNQTQVHNSPLKVNESAEASSSTSSTDTSKNNLSKTKMLRNLFFFQNDGNSS